MTRYTGSRKRQATHAKLKAEVAETRFERMVEAARTLHRAAMKEPNHYERERLKGDAAWWLDSARQEKDSLQ